MINIFSNEIYREKKRKSTLPSQLHITYNQAYKVAFFLIPKALEANNNPNHLQGLQKNFITPLQTTMLYFQIMQF